MTLSLGLRHELFLNPYEDRNRLAMFDLYTGGIVVASDSGTLPTQEYLPAVVSKLTDSTGKWKFPLTSDISAGFTPRRLLDTQFGYFGPRAGFTWEVLPKTVIRSGYGIFYSRYPIQYLLQTVAVNPPFAGTFSYSQSIANGNPTLTLGNPYSASGTASVSPAGIQKDFKLPSNQQWNLTIERELSANTLVTSPTSATRERTCSGRSMPTRPIWTRRTTRWFASIRARTAPAPSTSGRPTATRSSTP